MFHGVQVHINGNEFTKDSELACFRGCFEVLPRSRLLPLPLEDLAAKWR